MPTHSHCTSVTQSVRVNSERCYETLVFLNNRRRQLEVISLLTVTGPEVTWTGSHVDRKSRGPEVTWTGSHVDRKSRGPEVTWTGSHVDRKSRGPEVTWTGSHVDRKSRGPEVTWTGSHVDRKSRGPEVTRTGSHADRKSRGPEVTRTGSHVAKFNGGDWLNCWSSALLNFVASCAEPRFLAQRADADVKSVNRYANAAFIFERRMKACQSA